MPLLLAEHTAEMLQRSLVAHGAFEASCVFKEAPASREAVKRLGLSARARLERARREGAQTLLGFFYIGHGEHGRLLTANGALYSTDLQDLMRTVGATVNLMSIDACHSASLLAANLLPKGLRPTYNPLSNLSEDVLNAEGSVWWFSSGEGKLSYEGSTSHLTLFTGSLIWSLQHAAPNEAHIEFDELWRSTRRRTIEKSWEVGVEQRPIRYMSARLGADIPFTFRRHRRTAFVELAGDAGSAALVRHGSTTQADWLPLEPGQLTRVSVEPGAVEVLMYDRDGSTLQRREFAVSAGDSIGVGVASSDAPVVTIDACDGHDNDGDRSTDEDFACNACMGDDCLSAHIPRVHTCKSVIGEAVGSQMDRVGGVDALEELYLQGRLTAYRVEGLMTGPDHWLVPDVNDRLTDGRPAWRLFAEHRHEAIVCAR